MTVTRRTLVRMATALAATGATAVETVTAAQTSSPQAPTASSAAASSAALPNDELTAARAQLQRNAQQLAEVKLPPDTEPAFHFKA